MEEHRSRPRATVVKPAKAPAKQLVGQMEGAYQRPWTTTDVRLLKANARHGAAYIADLLDRSVKSVRRQAERLRVSLRPPGYLRGIVLGQPRGASWTRDERLRVMREHALAGVFDVAEAECQIRDEVAGRMVLCPRCARRPVAPATKTGLCRVCHARALSECHKDAIAELDARREYDGVRWQKKRRIDEVKRRTAEDDDG